MRPIDAVVERCPEIVGLDAANGIGGAGLPDNESGLHPGQDGLELVFHLGGGFPRPDIRHDFDGDAGQGVTQRRFAPPRIGDVGSAGAVERRGGAADYDDVELLPGNGLGDVSQAEIGHDCAWAGREDAFIAIPGKHGSATERAHKRQDQSSHAPPPVRAAPGWPDFWPGCGPGLRPSIYLYHEIRAAVAIIITMPKKLAATCMAMPSLISTMAKCAANDRNTPRQKISSECWPHKIAGRNHKERNPGQWRGISRIVTTARLR